MKAVLKRFWPRFNRGWPVLFIFLIWFIFASPYFLKGLVPYPSKYQVTFFHPWSLYEKWWGPVKNNAMPDVITQIYPWKHFTIEWLKRGVMPFWNPNSFSGNPHVGNFQSAVFSPFNLVFLVVPFIDAWSIVVLLQPLLAGLFMYLYMRELKVSETASVLGSVVFMFCGFTVVWMAYSTLSMAISFLPLGLYGIEKAYNKKKNIYLYLLSVCVILSFFSGHVQTSFYLVLFIVFYLLFFLVKSKNITYVLRAAAFLILGLIVSLIQIYPAFTLYMQSVRSSSLHVGGGIPWNYLVTMFAPDFYGNPVTRNDWYGAYAEWSSFIGIIPLFLAITALLIRRHTYSIFFGIAGFIALLLALDSPIHDLLVATRIPILATSIPSRMIVLFSFSAAVLSGFGLDDVQKSIKQKTYKKIVTILLALSCVLLLLWGVLYLGHVLPADKTVIAMKNMILPSFLLLSIIVIVIISKFSEKNFMLHTSIPFKALPAGRSLGKGWAKWGYFILLIFVSLDSLRFAIKWMPFDPRDLVFPHVPVIEAMRKNVGNGRVFGTIGTEVSTYYGLSSVEGYDPLYIERYGEFIRYASTGTWQNAERSVARLDRKGEYTHKALDLLGVNIIYHPVADTNTTWAFPVWEDTKKYSVIYQDEKFQLYKNNTALPRVQLFFDYEIITNKKSILERLFEDDFNMRRTIILEKKPKHSPQTKKLSGTARIETYTTNELVIKTNTKEPAILFLSDNYYPNWKAYVNGRQGEILRANYTFRAVEVPEGESTVVFIYKEYF